jgi:acyl-CoA thioesterase
MSEARTIREALQLEAVSPGHFLGWSVPHDSGRPVVEGGQMIGQMLVATARSSPGKRVRSVSAIFARPGRTDEPLDIEVDVMHAGRTLDSTTATVSQGGRLLSRALILSDRGDSDLIQHSQPFPPNAGMPEDAVPWPTNAAGTEVRLANGVDISVAGPNGPPELLVWFRVPDAHEDDPVVHQALAASRSHLFLIPAAMRPHDGIGVGMAHETLSTGVLSHAISFHEPLDASSWLLFAQQSTHAGEGRAYGQGHVFTTGGRHVASFNQDSLLRQFGPSFASRGKRSMVL